MSTPAATTAQSSTDHLPDDAASMARKEQVIAHGDDIPLHSLEGSSEGIQGQNDGREGEQSKMSARRFVTFVTMALLWQTAQLPPYLFGGIPLLLVKELGGQNRWVWFITGNLLGSAAICPFVGALSDFMGRRNVAIAGSVLVTVGQIVCSTAHSMDTFIAGMVVSGVGAGINELTALAGTAELAPTSKRGIYIAALILSVLPWCPSVLWAQLIAVHSSWRWVGVLSGIMSLISVAFVVFTYWPPDPATHQLLTTREFLIRIDWLGGLLSIGGITLFTAGILWGGYQYPWGSTHVLATLLIGIAMMVGFVCWETWGAKRPMFPRRLGKLPRTLSLLFVITFVAGANFFAVIMLWPSQAYNVYGHDPVGVGIRGMPFAFGVLGGCIINLLLLSQLRGRGLKWIMLASSCLMSAGCGALAAATRDNVDAVYAFLFITGIGVGGVVVPAAIVTTIICPDDLIATITSMTLAIRVIGGAVGYAVYFNVFVNKLVPLLFHFVGGTMVRAGFDPHSPIVEAVVHLTGASMLDEISELAPVAKVPGLFEKLVVAGQVAFAEAYPWVYYCSMAFGGVAIVSSLFLEDIAGYVDDHIAVIIR